MKPCGEIIVVIVGASRGIGRATAKYLISSGGKVAMIARNEMELKRAAAELSTPLGRALPIAADTRDEVQIRSAFDRVVQMLGPPHVVVNCAAVGVTSSVINGDVGLWRDMLDVNIIGMALACREAVRCFDKEVGGHIINVLSTSAHRLTEQAGFYAVSKHAAKVLTDLLRIEVDRSSLPIRVSAISPGRVKTGLFGIVDGNRQLKPEDIASFIACIINTPNTIEVDDLVLRSTRRS